MRALIFVANGVEDTEFLYPFYRLQEEDIPVDVAAPTPQSVTGKHGYECPVNIEFAKVNAENYDVLVLPGGSAPETVRLNRKALTVTRNMMENGRLVAAICHGIQVLISAGVLRERTATCWPGIRDDAIAAGVNFKDQEVVVDGNLITSRHPGDLPAFSREMFNSLNV